MTPVEDASEQTEPVAGDAAEPMVLAISGLTRSFGETRALVGASLEVARGEVHALAGENGSGKSTLIKILSGVLRAEAGEVRWQGTPVRFRNPAAAQAGGVATVFQETLVAPELSVLLNVVLGTDGIFRRRSPRAEARRRVGQALTDLGLGDLDVDRPLWTLSLAEQQVVSIARAIVRPWQLLVLDEGTSALDASQRDHVFAYLHQQSEEGKSVLFTSHRMDEVTEFAGTVSVLRLGQTIARSSIEETSARQILTLMARQRPVARALGQSAEERVRETPGAQEPVLKVQGLVLRSGGREISLEVGRGETLGLAGLEGQGQVEFAESLCGLHGGVAGSVRVADRSGGWATIRHFRDAKRWGIAYVPRDRKREGLFFPLSTLDNYSVASLGELNRLGVIRSATVRRGFREYAELLRLVHRRSGDTVGALSGGNQQKVLLARWLATRPRAIVLNDPLRGVDANTKEELYEIFRKLVADGLSIVFVSTEIVELLALCDRIAVFHDGNLQAMLPAGHVTDTDVVAAMFGHGDEVDEP
jgi:ABC-type sugar transport system ATPase subunit